MDVFVFGAFVGWFAAVVVVGFIIELIDPAYKRNKINSKKGKQ